MTSAMQARTTSGRAQDHPMYFVDDEKHYEVPQ